MKVFLTEHDTFNYTIYDEKEAAEEFCFTIIDDPEYFVEIPDNIVIEYKEVRRRFWELNSEIEKYKKAT